MNLDRNFAEMVPVTFDECEARTQFFFPELYKVATPPPYDVHIITIKEDEVSRKTSGCKVNWSAFDSDNRTMDVIDEKSGFSMWYSTNRQTIHEKTEGGGNHYYTLFFEYIVENKEKHMYWFL